MARFRKNLKDFSTEQVKIVLKSFGKSSNGSKATVTKRLKNHLEKGMYLEKFYHCYFKLKEKIP